MTVTKFSFLKRLPSLTVEDFSSYWHGPHVQALVDEGGHHEFNKTYVQNLILECRLDAGRSQFDGIAQMEVREDLSPTKTFQKDPRYLRSVRPDEEKFLDVGRCIVAYCNSELIRAAPAGAHFKVMLLTTCEQAAFHDEQTLWVRELEGWSGLGIKHHWIDRSKLTSMQDGSLHEWPYTAITELAIDSIALAHQLVEKFAAFHALRLEHGKPASLSSHMIATERVIY